MQGTMTQERELEFVLGQIRLLQHSKQNCPSIIIDSIDFDGSINYLIEKAMSLCKGVCYDRIQSDLLDELAVQAQELDMGY